MAANIDLASLGQFTGSERWFRHWTGAVHYTEGVHHLAMNGAAWLIDAIASYQTGKLLKGDLQYFQIWKLEAKDGKAVLTCQADSDRKPDVTQKIEFTDFPDGSVELYVELGSVDGINEHRVLMLTSER